MKRIFIAVKVNPEGELLRMFSSLKAILAGENIKWVDPANIHLTLVFLGNTDEKKITILKSMLSNTCSGFGEFDFNLTGTGVFKNIRDPRVLWVGIRSMERLIQLNKIISEGLKLNGLETEERQFKPHLTLGRVKSVRNIENLKSVLEKYSDQQLQVIHVNEVVLFESILMQTGPIYKPLGKYHL
jgi:RNA 2',3'-cyclic 3'-phosphodiesterase